MLWNWAVLLHGRTKTNEEFHTFLNPERKMGEGGQKNITGHTDDMLIEQPLGILQRIFLLLFRE